MHAFLRRNDRYQYHETPKMEKKFPGSRHKFPGKREILKPQISREISRPEFPGGNTSRW